MFVELFNFIVDFPPLWILYRESPPSRVAAGRHQHQSCTQVSAWSPGSLFDPTIFAFASCSSCSDQNWCSCRRTISFPCRRTVSFPKHGTVTASRLCLEVWPSQLRSHPILDLLFQSYNFLPVTIPKATAPVSSHSNFLFSLGLLEHLSLCFQCWAS